MSGWWLLLCAVITASAQVSQEIEAGQADRRSASAAAQTGNGTFFQPFINGINTFFNPSQFRNPLLNFRDNQQQQQQQRQPQQQPQFNTNFQSQPQPSQASQQFGATQQTFNFQDFRNNPTFQQDFSLTRFPQGQVTSEQQFSFVPRQPQPQPPPPNRFNPGPAGFVSPSARPQVGGGSQDNVPTVPAVTDFQRFRPSEASDVETNLRFQPSPRPAFEQPAPANTGIFPNSHSPTLPTLRTPTFTVPPS